jgi:hypothetical protein
VVCKAAAFFKLTHSPGNARNADIAALSDVASGVPDDEAKSEIAGNGKRHTPNAFLMY